MLRGEECLLHRVQATKSYALWFSVARLFDEYASPFLWNHPPDNQKAVFLQKIGEISIGVGAPMPEDNAWRVLW